MNAIQAASFFASCALRRLRNSLKPIILNNSRGFRRDSFVFMRLGDNGNPPAIQGSKELITKNEKWIFDRHGWRDLPREPFDRWRDRFCGSVERDRHAIPFSHQQ